VKPQLVPERKSNSLIGRECEDKARDFLLGLGFHFIFSRHKIAGIEVDLIMKSSEGHWHIIEVKSVAHRLSSPRFREQNVWRDYRLGARQKARLRRAAETLAIFKNEPVELKLVLVEVGGLNCELIDLD
jgi:Holliday junction resolvase-like predicted endonuclease